MGEPEHMRETRDGYAVAASRLAWPFDHAVAPAYRWPVDRVAELLREAGLGETARLITAPEQGPIREFHYGHLLFHKPGGDLAK